MTHIEVAKRMMVALYLELPGAVADDVKKIVTALIERLEKAEARVKELEKRIHLLDE